MTPLMQQYHDIKQRYPHALVLFQVGDFYELFYQDAERAALFLGITLTNRGKSEGKPIPLCGVPCHSVDHYLIKLVQGGFSVVICDQKGEVIAGKLVERSVTHVLTPGTLTDEKLLNPTAHSLLVVLTQSATSYALITVEVITGMCMATIIPVESWYLVEAELTRLRPQEIVLEASFHQRHTSFLRTVTTALYDTDQVSSQGYDDWCVQHITAHDQAIVNASPAASAALQLLFSHFLTQAPHACKQLRMIRFYHIDDALIIDGVSQRNLNIVHHPTDAAHTLAATLDHAATPMGSRTIRRWLTRPLSHTHAITQRLAYVACLVENTVLRHEVHTALRHMGDYERIAGRIALDRATIRDYRMLRDIFPLITRIKHLVRDTGLHEILRASTQHHEILTNLLHIVEQALNFGEPSDRIIREGFDATLDSFRSINTESHHVMHELEERERTSTGISNLKIKYTGIYGYTFETTRACRHLIPAHYEPVHSLTNHDRFTTAELRALEQKITHAHKYAQLREEELFTTIKQAVQQHHELLRTLGDELATLDGILSFAEAAVRHRYIRPEITEEQKYVLRAGRHPIVEAARAQDRKPYIANDLHLSLDERLWLITGPNMGGKSTFLRQAALAIIQAHAGSFVAATHAIIPRTDRLFTRIGAADNVAQGKSTFLVEMEEVALMCTYATERSFIILDEIGRGTGTCDGLALAQAILEYFATTIRPLGLCATHYHTLSEKLGSQHAIGVYHTASKQTAEGMLLLHRIQKGAATHSFGIEVARWAGLPAPVTERATQLTQVPSSEEMTSVPAVLAQPIHKPCFCDELALIDLDALSPRQAYATLETFRQRAMPHHQE
jgi:DNA mismatch repair protein MutS